MDSYKFNFVDVVWKILIGSIFIGMFWVLLICVVWLSCLISVWLCLLLCSSIMVLCLFVDVYVFSSVLSLCFWYGVLG